MQTKIRERACKPDPDDEIDLSDVLCWCITETWLNLKKVMPLWAAQGARFCSHEHIMSGEESGREEAAQFLEVEALSLEQRYRPRSQDPMLHFDSWDMNNPRLRDIMQRCRDFNAMGFTSAELDEEQERELAPEKEEERQVEHPPQMEAAQQLVHPDIQQLARTGNVSLASAAIFPAFEALSFSSAASHYDLETLPKDLLVTKDFISTIKNPRGVGKESHSMDQYHRSVQWIISVPSKKRAGTIEHLVIISGYEANNLLAIIQESAKVTLHLFSPRTNISYKSLDRLDLWHTGYAFSPDCVSRSLTMQLNLFTGSLYLRDYHEYVELCGMLGLLATKIEQGQLAQPDGFITSSVGTWGLTKSPVPFLRTLLMKIRREGEGLEKTHMGKLLNGIMLEEADFEVDSRMTG